jgi:hypothetical protein
MADGAFLEPKKSVPEVQVASFTTEELQMAAAKLYGSGYTRGAISRAMMEQLTPQMAGRPRDQRLTRARSKLRRWEMTQSFRDLVWDHAVVQLDMSTPSILQGVARKARSGRVDAAKLALELTGRYVPAGTAQPTQVAVVFQGIPRPGTDNGEVVELMGPEEEREARPARKARRDN